jgi:HlyD family secretion protein
MKKVVIATGVLVVAGIAAAAIFLPERKSGLEVYVSKVAAGEILSVVSASGEIQPRTKVNISSNVFGQIVSIPVKEGESVHRGDVLVRIDPTRYGSEVQSLEASLRMAHVAIEQEQNRNETLGLQLHRAEELKAHGVLPEESYEQTRLAYDSSSIQLKSLRESLSQAEAALQKAKDDLAKTILYAPMDGKVTALNTEVGEQVIVGTTNIPGSVLMVISDMSEVLAEVDVDETEVVKVRIGQPSKVTVDAVEKHDYRGRVAEIRNSARKKQDVNVFGVKVQIEDPDERLRPGMSARAKIEIEKREGALRVPIQAVVEKTEKVLAEEIAKAEGKEGNRRTDAHPASVVPPSAPNPASGAGTPGRTAPAAGNGRGGDPPATAVAGAASVGKSAAPNRGAEERKKDGDETVELVYVLRDGKARAVPVKTGLTDESNIEILSGPKDGELVITGPYRTLRGLKHGDKAREKKEEERGAATPSSKKENEN